MQRFTRAGLVFAGALTLAVGLAACGDDDGSSNPTTTEPTSSIQIEDVEYDVDLTGEAVVPGPGDDSTRGTAEINVRPGGTQVCYAIAIEDLAGITGAHIHEGREGVAGPVAVPLETPDDGKVEQCADTTSSIVDGLVTGARAFYLQVHTTDRPDGALRGQITGAGSDGSG